MLSLIADPIRDGLQARADHLSNLVGWANITVAVGVAMEGVEIIYEAVVWGKKKSYKKRERIELKEVAEIFPVGELRQPAESHFDEPRWVKRLLRVGLIVVVVGVIAEWKCGAKLEDAHNAIHQYDLEKITAAEKEAGDAAISAKTAHEESTAAKTEADAVKKEADAARKKVEMVANRAEVLQGQFDFRGPRGELFNGTNVTRPGLGKFMEEIKPFSGQKVEIRTNLPDIRDPQDREETQILAMQLRFLLGQVSGWLVSTGEGGHNWGVEVVVNRKAATDTRKAASALASGLGAVGLTGMQRQKPEVMEAHDGSEIDRTNFAPDTILLLVGQHP